MATGKRTFTWLLMREVCSHIESLASDPKYPDEYRNAFYAASREIGRNTHKFVAAAKRKVEWYVALEAHEEATNGG
jgi:hypothetical protein